MEVKLEADSHITERSHGDMTCTGIFVFNMNLFQHFLSGTLWCHS